MDFFQELSKQTAKLMNNFTDTMHEFSDIASESADSLGNIIVLRGKLEGLKLDLAKLYKEIGQKVVQDPHGDYSELIQKAQKTEKELKDWENQIASLKTTIQKNGAELKNKTLSDTKELIDDIKTDSQEVIEMARSTIKKDSESIKKDLNEFETETKNTEESKKPDLN